MENAMEAAEREQVEDDKEDTYFDAARLVRITTASDVLSWFALALGILTLAAGIWVIYLNVGNLPVGVSIGSVIAQLSPLMILLGLAALICFFFWVFLRAIGEGLYMMMDILDGQKRAHGNE